MGNSFRDYGLYGLALAMMTSVLAACGPLPKPFKRPPEGAANPLVTEAATTGIWVAPIDNTPGPMSKLLTESVAAGFKAHGIRATVDKRKNRRYRLKGRAEINQNDPSLPYVVLIHWTLFNRDGEVLGSHTQGVGGSRQDWDYGSPKVIREVGENIPEFITAFIDKADTAFIDKAEINGQPPLPGEINVQPPPPRLAGLWVSPIENAPGDGNLSLTRAIKAAIKGARIAVAKERRYAELVIEGRFSLTPPEDGLQRVKIVWVVLTQDGREIGRATQKNMVEAGTFDGPWGEVSTIVATAALEGIQGVLRTAGVPRYRLAPTPRVLKTEIPAARGEEALPPPRLELEGVRAAPKRPGN